MTLRSPSRQSPHDVGGKSGYGAPKLDPAEPVFAARWEAAVFAMMSCLGAKSIVKNTDQFRHAVERVDPHAYYGRWLGGLETLLLEAEALKPAELDNRVADLARQLGASESEVVELVADNNVASRPRSAQPEQVQLSVNAGSSVRYLAESPRFEVGQQVCTHKFAHRADDGANIRHSRLPSYAVGAIGEVVAWHRGWVLPDTNAHGLGEQPCHLYTVRFTAQALYGGSAEASVNVHLDLFEPYLSATL